MFIFGRLNDFIFNLSLPYVLGKQNVGGYQPTFRKFFKIFVDSSKLNKI